MAKNILAATPQPAFGELLRLSLEESGRYRVRLVQNGREALAAAEHIIFSLAILDAALSDPPLHDTAQGLRDRAPDMRLLVIPPQEGTAAPEVNAVHPDGTVGQPFYAPQLLEMIDRLTGQEAATGRPIGRVVGAPLYSSLHDAALAGAHLEEFLKESTAPGAMVIHTHQPWAAAGQLNHEALLEVANLLTRYSNANEGVDLARYVHLRADGGEYLIYATPLPGAMVLALVYLVNTPLTVIRAQAGRLARELRDSSPPLAAPSPLLDHEELLVDETELDDAQLEAEVTRLADLLSSMPTPDPAAGRPEAGDWVQAASSSPPSGQEFVFPWEIKDPGTPSPSAAEHFSPLSLDAAGEFVEALPAAPPALEAHHSASGVFTSAPGSTTPIEDTRPIVLRSLHSIAQVEAMAPALSNLMYTCILLPRLPSQTLQGALADRLEQWLPNVCLAYGWRLNGLRIHNEYVQFTVQVAPAISPGNVVRLIRQQISRKIFTDFPQLTLENPSSDFWATGYLIVSGFQPPSTQLVQDFIHQTRQRQHKGRF